MNIKKMKKDGMSIVEIAEKVNIPTTQVRMILNDEESFDDNYSKAILMYERGAGVEDVVKELGVSRNYAAAISSKYKIGRLSDYHMMSILSRTCVVEGYLLGPGPFTLKYVTPETIRTFVELYFKSLRTKGVTYHEE